MTRDQINDLGTRRDTMLLKRFEPKTLVLQCAPGLLCNRVFRHGTLALTQFAWCVFYPAPMTRCHNATLCVVYNGYLTNVKAYADPELETVVYNARNPEYTTRLSNLAG